MSNSTTIEQIIAVYRETGSVWKAGKLLGISGQTVHERLKIMGYPLASMTWSNEEVDELKQLVGECTIGEIARRLGRPYAGVALKISRLGLAGNPAPRKVKIPRGAGFDKASTLKHIKALESYEGKITQYARANSLSVDLLVLALQTHDGAWWREYSKKTSSLPEGSCPYCHGSFFPMSAKQIYCTRQCATEARKDQSYFGGNRRNTIGLAERTCQLCARKDVKGLSSHHIIGKENDPGNEFLVALCPGCHQLVGQLAGRRFVDDAEGWQTLIQLVMLRRSNGKVPGWEVSVEVEPVSEQELEEYTEICGPVGPPSWIPEEDE